MFKAPSTPSAAPATRDKPRRGAKGWIARLGENGFGYALLAPALLVILGLNLYPTVCGILASFNDQSLLNPNTWHWVSLANYQKLFSDPVFRLSFVHSLQLTIAAVVLQVVLGLAVAHLL